VSESWRVEVDTDAVRSAGSGMLATGDELRRYADTPQMAGHNAYGGVSLVTSAETFADRFAYLVRGLGDDAIDAGQTLRTSATAYEEADDGVVTGMSGLGTW
jgi:hypothetical protein